MIQARSTNFRMDSKIREYCVEVLCGTACVLQLSRRRSTLPCTAACCAHAEPATLIALSNSPLQDVMRLCGEKIPRVGLIFKSENLTDQEDSIQNCLQDYRWVGRRAGGSTCHCV